MSMHEYRLHVRGIFGRNRTVKLDSVLITDTETELSIAEVRRLMIAKIAEVKVKSGRVSVVRNPVKIENLGGIDFRTITMDLAGRNTVIGWRDVGAYL